MLGWEMEVGKAVFEIYPVLLAVPIVFGLGMVWLAVELSREENSPGKSLLLVLLAVAALFVVVPIAGHAAAKMREDLGASGDLKFSEQHCANVVTCDAPSPLTLPSGLGLPSTQTYKWIGSGAPPPGSRCHAL